MSGQNLPVGRQGSGHGNKNVYAKELVHYKLSILASNTACNEAGSFVIKS